MKIGILTHTLATNYGGLLQNYALQQVLIGLGHAPITLNHQDAVPIKTKMLSFASRSVKKMKGLDIPLRAWPTNAEKTIIAKNVDSFILKYIIKTPAFKMKDFWESIPHDLDAIVVGSDQVWNARYIKHIEQFYLSDVKNPKVKKIAYAASFGMNKWGYTINDTKRCSELAKRFAAISVRESGGLEYCKQYLGVDATLVLDPTLLLTKEQYASLVERKGLVGLPCKNMMVYVLDKSHEKDIIIHKVCEILGLSAHHVMAKQTFDKVGSKRISDCVFPAVEEWIQGFKDADFVITDSFHGTIFSIIFNKPFISIMNSGRGSERFTSLLGMFNLQSRLVTSVDEAMSIINTPIDFTKVNQLLNIQKELSLNFLNKSLNK